MSVFLNFVCIYQKCQKLVYQSSFLQVCNMSTVKKSHAVYGYIRNNYEHNIPDAIIKMCLQYFNEVVLICYKGKRFENLLSLPNGQWKMQSMKFNQDITFRIGLAPNGVNEQNKTNTNFLVAVESMTKNIERVSMCFQVDMDPIESSRKSYTSWTYANAVGNYEKMAHFVCFNRSDIEKQKRIMVKFIIYSFLIKYVNDEDIGNNLGQILYYPSLQSIQLKEKVHFKWKVDKSLIQLFKSCSPGFYYDSPIFNNICIHCNPNGIKNDLWPEIVDGQGKFICCIHLTSFPVNIGKMKVKVIFRTNIKETREEYIGYFTGSDNASIWCIRNMFDTELLKDELVFEVEAIIMKLYDPNNKRIPKSRWLHRNVVPTRARRVIVDSDSE